MHETYTMGGFYRKLKEPLPLNVLHVFLFDQVSLSRHKTNIQFKLPQSHSSFLFLVKISFKVFDFCEKHRKPEIDLVRMDN